MLLTIDTGNTNTSFGLFVGNKLIKKFDILTSQLSFAKLKEYLRGSPFSAAVISSVVPKAVPFLRRSIKKLSGLDSLIVGKDIKVPVKNLYRYPKQVGQDRLVNAFAGSVLYGLPLIVVDSGTAITFDVVSRKKEYLGGMILPGLNMSLEALHQKTALLPKIKLRDPYEFIGGDTQSSMLSGIIYGVAALVDELVRKIKLKIGKDAVVVGTGGSIRLIKKYCSSFDAIDNDLTLKGLNLISNL